MDRGDSAVPMYRSYDYENHCACWYSKSNLRLYKCMCIIVLDLSDKVETWYMLLVAWRRVNQSPSVLRKKPSSMTSASHTERTYWQKHLQWWSEHATHVSMSDITVKAAELSWTVWSIWYCFCSGQKMFMMKDIATAGSRTKKKSQTRTSLHTTVQRQVTCGRGEALSWELFLKTHPDHRSSAEW